MSSFQRGTDRDVLLRLLAGPGAGLWRWDPERGTITLDVALAGHLGLEGSRLTAREVMTPGDLEAFREDIRRARETVGPVEASMVIDTGDGRRYLDCLAVESGDGAITGHARDVTDVRLDERRLSLQREIGASVGAARRMDRALEATLDVIGRLEPFEGGTAYVPDDEGRLRRVASSGSRHPDLPDRPGSDEALTGLAEGDSRLHSIRIGYGDDLLAVLCLAGDGRPIPRETRLLLDRVSSWLGRALSRVAGEEELLAMYETARSDAETRMELLREVNHRVKNNLAAIIGLLYAARRYMDADTADVWKPIQDDLVRRIEGLATVHSMLSTSRWSPLPMERLLERIVNSALKALPEGRKLDLSIGTDEIRLGADQAHQVGMLVNELAANTLKYAVPERSTVEVDIEARLEDGGVRIVYRDNGPGFPEEVLSMERHSLGFDLMRNIVRGSLGGEMYLRNDGGAVVEMIVDRGRLQGVSHGRR